MNETTAISRRNALALAGTGAVGLALAGCSKEGPSISEGPALGAKQTGQLVSDFLAAQGLENYGDNANAAPPFTGIAYNPGFMALIHLKSNGPWEITSNHAHFAFAQPVYDPAARTKQAVKVFANKIQKGNGRFKDEPRGSSFQVYDRKPADPTPDFADGLNFSDFKFGHQHDLYIFLEHKPGDVTFDTANKNFVIFSEYFGNGAKADANRAFFNAELITNPADLGQLNGKGSLLRLDNFFTAKPAANYVSIANGGPVTSQVYKFNIVYVARSGIVMLIDPDTGNGVGYEP